MKIVRKDVDFQNEASIISSVSTDRFIQFRYAIFLRFHVLTEEAIAHTLT